MLLRQADARPWIHVFTGYGPEEISHGLLSDIEDLYRPADQPDIVTADVTTGTAIGSEDATAPMSIRDRSMGLTPFRIWLQHEARQYHKIAAAQQELHGSGGGGSKRPHIWVAHSLGCLTALRLYGQIPVDCRPDRVILFSPIWTLAMMGRRQTWIQVLLALMMYVVATLLLYIARIIPCFRVPTTLLFGRYPSSSLRTFARAKWSPIVLWATTVCEIVRCVYIQPFATTWLRQMPVQIVLFERDQLGAIPEHVKMCMEDIPIQVIGMGHTPWNESHQVQTLWSRWLHTSWKFLLKQQ